MLKADRIHLMPAASLDAGIDALTRQSHRAATERECFPRSILLAVDGTPRDNAALAWSALLARHEDARVHVLCPEPVPEALAGALHHLRLAGVRAEGRLAHVNSAHAFADEARETQAELVVMAAPGHDPAPFGAGLAVKEQVEMPFLLARGDAQPADVLVAVDGSPASRCAAIVGADLARRWERHAALMHVVGPWEPDPRTLNLPPSEGHVDYLRCFGDPASCIVEVAVARRSGLIAMGSRGLGRLGGLLLGSVSSAVSRRAPCSVLTMPE